MFLGMGAPELIIILIIILIIFGPKNLPKLGKSLGKTVKNVREGMEEDDDKIEAKSTEATDAKVEDVKPEAATEEPAAAADSDADAGEPKFCPACGAKNPSTNAFCAKCGTKLQ